MKEIWTRIEAWLHAHVPSEGMVLSPGAAEEEITATERLLGVTFPEDVRDSFRLHDGQSGEPWLVWGCELLSLGRIRGEWNAWKELLDRGTFENFRSHSDGRVVEDWWHARWVPLTHDGAGNHYCLDLNPGPKGRAGQIIQMWHDDSERKVVAPSYRAWLAAFADALEAGALVYSADYVGLVPPEDVECQRAPQEAPADCEPGVAPRAQGSIGDTVRATFRARRRRQVVLLILGLPFIAILGGFKGFLGGLGDTAIGVLVLLTLAYVLFAVTFSLRNWRCPSCNKWLGNQLNPPTCVGCGVRFGP